MQTTNLTVEFYQGPLFQELISSWGFDTVVAEKSQKNLGIESWISFVSLEETSFDFGISGKLTASTLKAKKILLIVDQFPLYYFYPFVQFCIEKQKHITILEITSWAMSKIDKWFVDSYSFGLLWVFALPVFEVLDRKHLLGLVKDQWSCVIRLQNYEVFDNFIHEQTQGHMDSLGHLGFTAENGVVISSCNYLFNIMQWLSLAQQQGTQYGLFSFDTYSFDFSKEAAQAIRDTKKLVVIVDHAPYILQAHIKARLFEHGLQNIAIHFLTPQHRKLQTILRDYAFEQLQFDAESLAAKLIKL